MVVDATDPVTNGYAGGCSVNRRPYGWPYQPVRRTGLNVTARVDGGGDVSDSVSRLRCTENRRARHEQRRPGERAGAGGLGVDPAVHLQGDLGPKHGPQALDLGHRLADERLAAPAG